MSERAFSQPTTPGITDSSGQSPFWDAVGRRFFGMDYPQAEVIVVDNGSEDGTAEWLRMVYKPTNPDQIHIIPLDRNYGISRGSNVALEAIFKAMPRVDVICKVDNDCLVISDGVIRELARLVDPAAAAGPFGFGGAGSVKVPPAAGGGGWLP